MKKNVYTVLGILIMLIVAGLFLSLDKDNGGNNDKQDNEQQKAGDTFQADVEPDNGISDWQVYENQEAQFGVRYPKGWTYNEYKDEYGNINVAFVSPESAAAVQKEIKEMGQNYGQSGFDILITYSYSVENEGVNKVNELGAKTLDELIEKYPASKKIGNIQLDGEKAVEVVLSGESDNYGIFTEKDRRIYEILFSRVSTSSQDLTEIEKKMLATFKIK